MESQNMSKWTHKFHSRQFCEHTSTNKEGMTISILTGLRDRNEGQLYKAFKFYKNMYQFQVQNSFISMMQAWFNIKENC